MARSDDLCTAIKTLLATASAEYPPGSLEQGFAPELERISMSGTSVYIFSLPKTTVGAVSRAKELQEYKVAIVIVERYTEAAADDEEAVPEEWLQDRKSWVEDYVFDVLNSKGMRPLSMWPNRCEWTTDVDWQQLRSNKVFWSEIEVDYREIVDN